MAVNLSPIAGAGWQFFDNNGVPLAGGKLYSYAAGTTTPATTYTSNGTSQANSNPIILDAAGRPPSEIWLPDSSAYKFVLKDSNDVLIGTWDNIIGINSNFQAYAAQEETQTATQGQTVFTLTTMTYAPATNNLIVYVNGSKQIVGVNYTETSDTVVTFIDGLNVGDVVDFSSAIAISTNTLNADVVTYDPPFGNAVATNVAAKLAQTVSVKDFGAVGDGTTDDTTAIQNAIDALSSNGGSIYFPAGQYLISSTLTITTQGITLVGTNSTALWDSATSILSSGSQIVKKSTMTTDAIQVSELRFQMQDLSVRGQTGNTGDGIYLQNGYNPILINVSVAGVGGSGIRIGPKTNGNYNVNGWQLTNVTSQYNGVHGVYIYDQTTAGLAGSPNANAGTATGLNLAANTSNGLHIENGQFNTFVGLVSQQNTGYGVSLIGTVPLSLYTTFSGGDIEANTAGNWNIGTNAKHITVMGSFPNYPTLDPSQFNTSFIDGNCSIRGLQFQLGNVLNEYVNGTGTPSLGGTSASGFNTYTTQSLAYTRIGNIISCEGYVQLSALGTGPNAMTGNLLLQLDNSIPSAMPQSVSDVVFSLTSSGGLTVGSGYSINLVGIMQQNTKYLYIYKVSTTDGSLTPLPISAIGNAFGLYFSGNYLTTP